MREKQCNGWTNRQTWNINLIYGKIFSEMANTQRYDDVEHMADSFESLVGELEYAGLKDNSLAQHALGIYLDLVNWNELAAHFFEEEVEEVEEDGVEEE